MHIQMHCLTKPALITTFQHYTDYPTKVINAKNRHYAICTCIVHSMMHVQVIGMCACMHNYTMLVRIYVYTFI